MKTVSLDSFYAKVAPMAETVPAFIVRGAVVDTVADICKKTNVLTARVELMTKKGEYEYAIPTQMDLVPLQIRGVFCDGEPLAPLLYDELLARTGGDPFSGEGKPVAYCCRRPDWLLVYPCAKDAYKLDVDLTLSISRKPDSKSIPDVFYTYYMDQVVWGSLGRIYRIAGQPYTNIRMADEYDMRYMMGLAEVKHDASREFTRSSGHIPFRRII